MLDEYLQQHSWVIPLMDFDLCFKLLRLFGNSGYYFRGHSDVDYALETTLDRFCKDFKRNVESILIYEFRRRIHHYYDRRDIPETTFELLALMQHFGVPTRLLDFTKSPWIALYFAVRDVRKDKDAAIWAIRPHEIRQASLNRIRADDKELLEPIMELHSPFRQFTREDLFSKFFMGDREIILDMEPMKMNERLTAQQGLFFVTGSSSNTFEKTLLDLLTTVKQSSMERINVALYAATREEEKAMLEFAKKSRDLSVVKFIIPKQLRVPVVKELQSMNLTASFLFPGVEGPAQALKEKLVPMDAMELAQYLWVIHNNANSQ